MPPGTSTGPAVTAYASSFRRMSNKWCPTRRRCQNPAPVEVKRMTDDAVARESANGYEYDIFISYRSKDGRATAQWLSQQLRSYRAPKGFSAKLQALRVYRDVEEERVTTDIWETRI